MFPASGSLAWCQGSEAGQGDGGLGEQDSLLVCTDDMALPGVPEFSGDLKHETA